MKNYFITGTDTGVGKTVVSAILAKTLNAQYWKPIQSGLADEISDQEKIKLLTGFSDSKIYPSHYNLQASLSPDQAAQRENITIDLNQCIIPEVKHNLIIEGAGGIFVPLNENNLLLDLIKQVNFPVIIVARGTLGTINHTLLTISALQQYNIKIHGVVFNGELNKDNQYAIEKWGKIKTLFHVPSFENFNNTTLQQWIDCNKSLISEAL